MCGQACLHTCTPCVLSSVRFTLHLLCFSQALPSTCLPYHRFTKHLLALSPCLPSTCWAVAQVYQAPALLFPKFIQHLMAFPRLAKHLPGFFPRFTKHLLGCFPALPSTCDKSVNIWFFVKMTHCFWFAAACGGGAFLFYIKKLFNIKSLPFVVAHQRVRLPYFLWVFW